MGMQIALPDAELSNRVEWSIYDAANGNWTIVKDVIEEGDASESGTVVNQKRCLNVAESDVEDDAMEHPEMIGRVVVDEGYRHFLEEVDLTKNIYVYD